MDSLMFFPVPDVGCGSCSSMSASLRMTYTPQEKLTGRWYSLRAMSATLHSSSMRWVKLVSSGHFQSRRYRPEPL